MNGRSTSMVLGDKEHVLYGPGFIVDELCGKKFRISSKSFYQVNSVQTEVLYETAIRAAGLTGKETIIDAYCGIGTIGIAAANQAEESWGGIEQGCGSGCSIECKDESGEKCTVLLQRCGTVHDPDGGGEGFGRRGLSGSAKKRKYGRVYSGGCCSQPAGSFIFPAIRKPWPEIWLFSGRKDIRPRKRGLWICFPGFRTVSVS